MLYFQKRELKMKNLDQMKTCILDLHLRIASLKDCRTPFIEAAVFKANFPFSFSF